MCVQTTSQRYVLNLCTNLRCGNTSYFRRTENRAWTRISRLQIFEAKYNHMLSPMRMPNNFMFNQTINRWQYLLLIIYALSDSIKILPGHKIPSHVCPMCVFNCIL